MRLCIVFYLIIIFFQLSLASAENGIAYRVTIEGVDDHNLRQDLESVSRTFALQDKTVASLGLLQRRVDLDISQIQTVLRSQSFYGNKAKALIDSKVDPVQVKFEIDLGPSYLMQSYEIHLSGSEQADLPVLPGLQAFGVDLGKPAKNKTILEAEKKVVRFFKTRGYPFPQIEERKVVVDHATQKVSVSLLANPGRAAKFGPTRINGLVSVDEIILIRKLPWQEGDPFNVELLEKVRKRFSATGLFSTVEVKPEQIIRDSGALPILVNVKERDYRTIKAGLTYATDEGIGGKASWLHRNFLSRGEHLTVKTSVSEIAYEAEGGLRKPDFFHPDQSLLMSLRIAEERPDAFTSRNIRSSLQIQRTLLKDAMTLKGGIAFELSDVDQQEDQEYFALLSFPLELNWDTSDNLLDPMEGRRFALGFTPFYDTISADIWFFKGYGSYNHYLQLSEKPCLVLAGHTALGATFGAERSEIPADQRFYAGGAGSIRGYEYQSVGPLRNQDPTGGRSLFELSFEFRLKLTEKIGLAAFVDGGSVFTSSVPDFSEKIRWGTGGGVRYYTPIGPLRLDVGVPLNRRKDIDDAFQIYVSLGQAF